MEQREEKKIRLLKAEEIECRIGTISENGVSLLLYLEARSSMRILDEVFGNMNWKRHHEAIDSNLYCVVSVWDEKKKQWIDKMDVGIESFADKEKGQASDAFKRACVCWGVGRELYTAPFIWIAANKTRIEKKQDNRGERWICKDSFKVQRIVYSEDREIIGLVIINQDGRTVYELAGQRETTQNKKPAGAKSSDGSSEKATAINKELQRTGVALDTVLARFGVSSIEDLSETDYAKALGGLKKSKSRVA